MDFRTYTAIDLDALDGNFNSVRAKLPPEVKILAVVKADAYGHGAVDIAKRLEGRCDFFGIACLDEARELLDAGIKTKLLILGKLFSFELEQAVKNDIRIPIFSLADAQALSAEAKRQGRTAYYHFCVDTGMSRIGFQVSEESADECKAINALENIEAEGIFSHLARADEKDLTKSREQIEKFRRFCGMLAERGVNPPIKHICNSAGIMNFDEVFDMCRMGIITYGLYPSHEVDSSLLGIKPVMSWKTRISHIKTLEAGREISYGGTYTTPGDRVIATVPVGYADGYPRSLSNKGRVLVGGEYAPIVGRVCMDQFMIDVTGIDCGIDDEVVLVGSQGGRTLSMEEVSETAGSFNYELPCRIALRVPRVYYSGGEIIGVRGYRLKQN
jgi:alanine racemase